MRIAFADARNPVVAHALQVKDGMRSSGIRGEKQCYGDVADRNAPDCYTIQLAVMRMSVQSERGPVPVNDFSEPRATEIGKNFLRFSLYGFGYGRVMCHNDDLARTQHRHGPLQLHCFINRSLHEGLSFFLSEGGQSPAAEAADKPFGSGKAHAVPFITAAVKNFDSFIGHHFHQLLLLTAFVVVISQYGHDWNPQAD